MQIGPNPSKRIREPPEFVKSVRCHQPDTFQNFTRIYSGGRLIVVSAEEALAQLRRRLQRLYRENGEPSRRDISRSITSRSNECGISHTTVVTVLKCAKLPQWRPLELIVKELGGDTESFKQLWIAVREAADGPTRSGPGGLPQETRAPADLGRRGTVPVEPLTQRAMPERVARQQLGTLAEVGRGGTGTVYRLLEPLIPGFDAPLAYKEISPDLSLANRARAARAMDHSVALKEHIEPADLVHLERVTAWPLATVEDGGVTVGTILPLLPADFFTSLNSGGQSPRLRIMEFQFFVTSERHGDGARERHSSSADQLMRLALVAQLSHAIALLHKYHIVYGDLCLRNAAVALNPPRIMLLDCDEAGPLDDPHRRQPNSPYYLPPENRDRAQAHQDLVTDVYKLGLCILRGMAGGDEVTKLTEPQALTGILNREGIELVRRALSADRRQRPTAHELSLHLLAYHESQLATFVWPEKTAFVAPEMPTEPPIVKQSPARLAEVYISYRRSEPHAAYLLYEYLSTQLGDGIVLINIDDYELGTDFLQATEKAVSRCRLLLAVIGPGWLATVDSSGSSGLDDPEDLVRMEIESAIRHEVTLIPVLLDSTPRPKSTQLPETISALARLREFVLRSSTFKDDAMKLAKQVSRLLGTRE